MVRFGFGGLKGCNSAGPVLTLHLLHLVPLPPQVTTSAPRTPLLSSAVHPLLSLKGGWTLFGTRIKQPKFSSKTHWPRPASVLALRCLVGQAPPWLGVFPFFGKWCPETGPSRLCPRGPSSLAPWVNGHCAVPLIPDKAILWRGGVSAAQSQPGLPHCLTLQMKKSLCSALKYGGEREDAPEDETKEGEGEKEGVIV
uniref:Uncharacterized protein n=1 Tax=Knipowitschia caucasica TaxID=637954 RepID=A0AAV2KZH9_KNICA